MGWTYPPRRLSALTEFPVRHEVAVRREAPSLPGGVKGLAAGLSQQAGEAEGSPTVEMHGRAVSSADNDGTGRYCQTIRVRQARREGVREEPVVMLRKRVAGSNLVDVGRIAARDSRRWWGQLRSRLCDAGGEATLKVCGVGVAMLSE